MRKSAQQRQRLDVPYVGGRLGSFLRKDADRELYALGAAIAFLMLPYL